MASVYVVAVQGGSSSIGQIPAGFGVATQHGIIQHVSGNLCYTVSGDQDGWNYDNKLRCTKAHAEAFWGWPTGNVTLFDMVAQFPNGNVTNFHSMTGVTLNNNGTNPVTYPRANS